MWLLFRMPLTSGLQGILTGERFSASTHNRLYTICSKETCVNKVQALICANVIVGYPVMSSDVDVCVWWPKSQPMPEVLPSPSCKLTSIHGKKQCGVSGTIGTYNCYCSALRATRIGMSSIGLFPAVNLLTTQSWHFQALTCQ